MASTEPINKTKRWARGASRNGARCKRGLDLDLGSDSPASRTRNKRHPGPQSKGCQNLEEHDFRPLLEAWSLHAMWPGV